MRVVLKGIVNYMAIACKTIGLATVEDFRRLLGNNKTWLLANYRKLLETKLTRKLYTKQKQPGAVKKRRGQAK